MSDESEQLVQNLIDDFGERSTEFRISIDKVGAFVRNLMNHQVLSHIDPIQGSEVRASIMLAYRHLEDARMRLGKAFANIVSCSDRTEI